MTVAELREELLNYPQDAVVVRLNRDEYQLEALRPEGIAMVGETDEGLFSVPMVHVA